MENSAEIVVEAGCLALPGSMPTTELPTPETSGAPSEPAPTQPLSKKAQKKLARAARTAELKLERRAAEKERKKEKKRLLAQKRAAGELDAQDVQAARKKRRTGEGPRTAFGARVVVDLGFDDMMTENVSPSGCGWCALVVGAGGSDVAAGHRRSSRSRLSLHTRTVRTSVRTPRSRCCCSPH